MGTECDFEDKMFLDRVFDLMGAGHDDDQALKIAKLEQEGRLDTQHALAMGEMFFGAAGRQATGADGAVMGTGVKPPIGPPRPSAPASSPQGDGSGGVESRHATQNGPLVVGIRWPISDDPHQGMRRMPGGKAPPGSRSSARPTPNSPDGEAA